MVYAINEGSNYPTNPIPIPTLKKSVKFRFKIEGQFPYNIGKDQDDINKIWGISDGLNHNKHSVRLGWRNLGKSEVIELFLYVHNGRGNPAMGGRNIWFEKVGEIMPNTWGTCQLGMNRHGDYYLLYNGVRAAFPRSKGNSWMNYYIPPYWGGDTKAPGKYVIHLL